MGDLLASHESQEVRHAVLKFLSALIRGQYQTLGLLRGYFFEVVRSHQVPEDLMERCFGVCVRVFGCQCYIRSSSGQAGAATGTH